MRVFVPRQSSCHSILLCLTGVVFSVFVTVAPAWALYPVTTFTNASSFRDIEVVGTRAYVADGAAGGAVGLTGVALGVIGFQPGAVQAPEATQALRVLISVLPAALVVLSAAILLGTGRSGTRLRRADKGTRHPAELMASE